MCEWRTLQVPTHVVGCNLLLGTRASQSKDTWPQGRTEAGASSGALNLLLHVFSGEGIILSAECLAKQKKKIKNPSRKPERLECSSSPISCLLQSNTIICFAGTVLQCLCKTREKLWHWVRNEIDDIAAAGKEQKIPNMRFLPNPKICTWV